MITSEHAIGFNRAVPKLHKMAHPLDKSEETKAIDDIRAFVEKLENATNKETQDVIIKNADGSMHVCKADGTRIYEDQGKLGIVKPNGSSMVCKDNSAVQIRPNGTVVTVNEDGSRSEIRPNGTIVAYFADGSIKFFRTSCWSG